METEPESHVVFYDTETTGLPLWKERSEDPRQPHIVSLAAILVDLKTRETVASMDVIVKPEGWTSDAQALATHGISHELAMDVGIPEMFAVQMLMMLWKGRVRIGHNEPFDARIVRYAQKRYVRMFSETQCEAWKGGRKLCTQTLSTPIVKAAPSEKMLAKGMTWSKSAKLEEAYEYFFGKPMEGAHNALRDVLACRDVFFAIQDRAGMVFPDKDAAAPKPSRATAPAARPASAALAPASAPAPAPAPTVAAAPAGPAVAHSLADLF